MPLEPKEVAALRRLSQTRGKAYDGDHLRAVNKMLDGDHWMGGEGWVGPRPQPDDPKSADVMEMIRRVFVSQNLVKQVSRRHRNAVAGDEPDWGFTPQKPPEKDAEGNPLPPEKGLQDLIDQADSALTSWWDAKNVWHEVRRAVLDAVSTGRGVVRLYIPNASLVEDPSTSEKVVPKGSLEEVLSRIYLSRCDPKSAGVLKDDDGVTVGGYFYSTRKGKSLLEWQYLGEDGKTYVMVEQLDKTLPEAGYPLGGELMMFELELDPLVTPQAVSIQKALNKYLTMHSRNLDVAGFLKETILNGQMPGDFKPDPENPAKEIFVPHASAKTGPGVREYISPYVWESEDPTRPAVVLPASIDSRQPVNAANLTPTKDDLLEALYQEVSQLHVLISGDATASGKSRVEALNDFRTSLEETVTAFEALLRWLLGTVLRLASYFSGDSERFAALRPYAQATVVVSQPSGEDIRVDGEMVKDGRMSRETAMLRSGRVSDPAAEKRRIRAEQRERLDDPNARRNSIAGAVSAGLYSQRQGLLEEGKTETEADADVARRVQEQSQLQSGLPGTGN